MHGNQYGFLPCTMESNYSVKMSKFSQFSLLTNNFCFKLSNLNIALGGYLEKMCNFLLIVANLKTYNAIFDQIIWKLAECKILNLLSFS